MQQSSPPFQRTPGLANFKIKQREKQGLCLRYLIIYSRELVLFSGQFDTPGTSN